MRDSVLKLLDQWEYKNSTDVHDFDKEVNSFELQGILKFLKEVAYSGNDDFLLGKVTRIEIRLENRAKEESERVPFFNLFDDPYTKIGKICREEFFEKKTFIIDMSKYKKEIDENLDIFRDQSVLSLILNYIDEKTVIGKAYERVVDQLRNNVDYENSDYIPTIEEVAESFEAVKENIYRLADNYIAGQIKKAKTV